MTRPAEIDGVDRIEHRGVQDRRPALVDSIFLNGVAMRPARAMAGFTGHTRHDVAHQTVANGQRRAVACEAAAGLASGSRRPIAASRSTGLSSARPGVTSSARLPSK